MGRPGPQSSTPQVIFSRFSAAPRAGRVQKGPARRRRDSVSPSDMQLEASQAAPVARAARGLPLTAPSPPLPSMPRLPPLRSKVWVRQAMAVVAPPPRVIAEARRSSALEELQQLRHEEARADEDAAAPSVDSVQWSSPLKVLQYPHPRLRAANARLSAAAFGPQLKQLAHEMFEIMYRDDGVGLAAPQVGVNVRLMVFNAEGLRGSGEELLLANPRIVTNGKGQDVDQEGCLSFRASGDSSQKLLHGDVERWLRVKVEAQDGDGRHFTRSFRGFAARVFQHEYDHLQGTLFPDRMTKEDRGVMLADLRRLEDDYLRSHPGDSIRRYQ